MVKWSVGGYGTPSLNVDKSEVILIVHRAGHLTREGGEVTENMRPVKFYNELIVKGDDYANP